MNDGDAKALPILALDDLRLFVTLVQNGDLYVPTQHYMRSHMSYAQYTQSYTHTMVSHPDIMKEFFTGFPSSHMSA